MKKLTSEEIMELTSKLKLRFEENMSRHPNIKWENVFEKLNNNQEKLFSLNEMEKTGGEPDIVLYDKENDQYIFYDCSKESPVGRRSICYDQEALESRKKFKPKNSATNMAEEMGIEILDEDEYKYLQMLGEFDLKTSSWLNTPVEIRKLGGAIFGDRRYNQVFIYHNGVESYYESRGFRGKLKI